MGSQRFCLRWNNHQTNLLSVFDQLLHDEAFVDVTLAVEGQFLRAHKMVLSACSPYFQALFVGHPDKHPIVILKDVPYSDMRSLLDFMYRGEVSVDQDRLTAFLKVAESLRIKGLTEVNEERCDLPSIANSLLNQTLPPPPPPPSLHRLPMPPIGQPKRPQPPNPMLNSALTAPKRKRGRPRKLSGSSPNPPHLSHSDLDHEDQKPLQSSVIENHLGPPAFPQMPLPQQHPQQNNAMPLPEIPAANFRSCLGPVGPPQGIHQPSCGNATLQPPSNLPHPPPADEPESPKIEDDDEDDCDEMHKMEDGEDDLGLEEDEPPDPQHRKADEPKPSTSGQDSLASFQSSTQSDGERFSSSGQKMEQSSGYIEMDEDSSNIMASFDDMIACSPASSEIEENVEAEFSSRSLDPEFVDDDISQFEEDSLRSLIGRLPDTDGNRRKMDKMSIRKFCLREGDQVHRCTICSKAYTHISNFCRHFLSAHCGAKQEVHCPICNKPFTRKDNMMTHAKQVHGLSCMRGSLTELLPNYDQQTD